MSKSSKLDDAINKAHGIVPDKQAIDMFNDPSGDIESLDLASFHDAAKDGYSTAARFHEMKPGQQISGFLVDRCMTLVDDPAGVVDLTTGRVKQNHVERLTFELRSGAVISILSSAQLDTAFRGVPADGSVHCRIGMGDTGRTKKGRQMHQYLVQLKRGARTATVPASAKVIEAHANV